MAAQAAPHCQAVRGWVPRLACLPAAAPSLLSPAQVVREGFNPDLGLFLPTADQRLYPNPHVRAVMSGGSGLRMLEFLGKVLGKAMYEGE